MAPELFSSKHGQSKRTMLESYLNINNLRQVQAAYDPRQSPFTLQLQLLIKAQKGVIVDSEALGRDSHVVSKHLFLWANEQAEESLQDVGDRLAFLAYQVGDLQHKHASSLERARGDLKELRNMENDLTKIRDREKALGFQLGKLRQDLRPKPETVEKLAATAAEHTAIQQELRRSEATLSLHKRRLLRSSYRTQFEAMRELGEKLSIISGYGSLLLDELNDDSPLEYDGKDRTAWIKMAAAASLAVYKEPIIERPSIGQSPVGMGFSPSAENPWSFHPPYSHETHQHTSQGVSGSSTGPSSSHYDSHQHGDAPLSYTHPATSLHPEVGGVSTAHSTSQQLALPPRPGSQSSIPYNRPIGSGQNEYSSGPLIGVPSGGASARPTTPGGTHSSVTATGVRVPVGPNPPIAGTLPNRQPDDCPKDDDVPPAYTAVPEAR